MKVEIKFKNIEYEVNLMAGLDISIEMKSGSANVNCYFADTPIFETIKAGDFIGSVKSGGSVNYHKVTLTPHGNGTHTECYGHISADQEATIYNLLKDFLSIAQVVSVTPRYIDGDQIICWEDVKPYIKEGIEALIIRTSPNDEGKKKYQYSGTNPPYLESKMGYELANLNIKHLLVDLPSVDKEVDGGQLAVHKGFWNYPKDIRKECTISELIYVEDFIKDDLYLLNLQVVSWQLDACPSKPILYHMKPISKN